MSLIAEMIGEYWNTTITQGRGQYLNWNAEKDSDMYLGIEMARDSITDEREVLKRIARYLTKPDFYAKVMSKDYGKTKGRTLGRGEVKTKLSNRDSPTETFKIKDL